MVRRLSAPLLLVLAGSSCLNRPITPSQPQTNNRFVDQIRQTAVDKVDLLFVVDNSVSMADKQQILKEAVPSLLGRLINPPCVDEVSGAVEAALGDAEQPCRAGFRREFEPVADIHIGVITSSLGTQGPGSCAANPDHESDRGLLLPSVRDGLPSWNGTGFLAWDPRAKYTPAGYADLELLTADFAKVVEAVHDDGCGFESTLEAWYRFLIDPEPPSAVTIDPTTSQSVAQGIDQQVLEQRAAFLRPDSLVGILMLSDEDDCSISDAGFGWLLSDETRSRPRPTSACATDPESVCCRPCTLSESVPPAGCSAIADDPACAVREYPLGNAAEDRRNLRCFDQKRRYGMDFLQPVERYIAGLSDAKITNRAGELVDNPLFSAPDGAPARDPAIVFLGGIVGVPWQDIATPESIDGAGLEYLSSERLLEEGRWPMILGEPHADNLELRAPTDPLMVASPDPRTGTQPILMTALGSENSENPRDNSINGHEYHNPDNTDLQYACIFPLQTPVACTSALSCDCQDEDVARNRPLCQPPEGGPASTTQYFAKAYPASRHLEVLKGLGRRGIVASICPKVTDREAASYGYNPALDFMADIFVDYLADRCLPRALEVQQGGQLPCRIAEATRSACDCSALPGRKAASAELDSAVRSELVTRGQCGAGSGIACSDYCVCEIEQSSGDALLACQTEESGALLSPGYCYIDAEHTDESGAPAPIGSPALVAGCPIGNQRKLRFVGENTPQNGAPTFIACAGATLGQVK